MRDGQAITHVNDQKLLPGFLVANDLRIRTKVLVEAYRRKTFVRWYIIPPARVQPLQ